MSGDKDRFSIAAFIMPNEGTIIKTPKELIDGEHPQLFKDFDFMKFFFFAFSNPARRIDSGQLLYDFAALSPPAWSNGRLKSTNHKVMMSGDKDRFSIAAFIMPNEGTIIKTPKELIDEEHPQLFKDFDFMKFFFFAFSNPARRIDSGHLLYDFAALSPPVSN
ncbi:hypothetical protein Gotur_023082, partial [Gossypium turneri]